MPPPTWGQLHLSNDCNIGACTPIASGRCARLLLPAQVSGVPGATVLRWSRALLPAATDHAFQKRLLPSWCSYLAHAISLLLVAACFGVSVWIGLGFTSSVALMWLISGIFSFLASFLIWEPLKVRAERGQACVHACVAPSPPLSKG